MTAEERGSLRRRPTSRNGRGVVPDKNGQLLRAAMFALGVVAIGSLAAEYGFSLSARAIHLAHILDFVALWGFALTSFGRFAFADSRREHFRRYALDIGLATGLILAYVAAAPFAGVALFRDTILYFLGQIDVPPNRIDRLYANITKLYILVSVVLGATRYGHRILRARFRPVESLVLSFVITIFIGATLLMLPSATARDGSLSAIDACFTSTSAVCVTGLIVRDTATEFTMFGQTIIMALIQVGGLGYMTLASFFVLFLTGNRSLREVAFISDALQEASASAAHLTLRRIITFTIAIELAGAALCYAVLPRTAEVIDGRPVWFYALFHAVSAFCNAGFALWRGNLSDGAFRNSLALNAITATLIVLGGLGFAVLSDVSRFAAPGNRRRRLSLHSKMALSISATLIVVGSVGYFALERHATLAGQSVSQRAVASMFQSVTARTAGFNTTDTASIAAPTALMFVFLMFIGGSPGSTAGGIKTTTFGIAVLFAAATARGHRSINIGRRRLPEETVSRAMTVVLFSIAVITGSTFALTLTEPDATLTTLLFEETSAFATVGLSMGITSSLSALGKSALIVSMFLGRLGPLTIAIALSQRTDVGVYDYPTAEIAVL